MAHPFLAHPFVRPLASRRILAVALLALLVAATARAELQTEYEQMSLEELLQIDLSVATLTGMTSRESPGVVTLITAEEIEASGARDLIDVLRLVPGFQLGVDVQGVVGLSMRGLWGHEGKILLLVDGQEFNESLYSTLQVGNHFSARQIAKVELIRGPGSAIYGGNAELAVINITTKGADELDGFAAVVTDGEMEGATARRSIDLQYGKRFGELSVSALGFLSSGARSDRTFTDFAGDSYDMADSSDLDARNLNLGLGYRGFSLRLIVDDYLTTQRDLFGENLPYATDLDFRSRFAEVGYEWRPTARWTVKPRLRWKWQESWRENDPFFFYDKRAERATAGVTAFFAASDRVQLLAGAEGYRERAEAGEGTDPGDLFADGHSVSYDNLALFGQGTFATSLADFTLGARYENHSQFGASFVPRLGITRVAGRFHLKLLAARAFRAPGIENIRLEEDIEPEHTTAYEVEAGYQLTPESLLTLNLFSMRIDDPIVYFVDSETAEEGYRNFDRTGTRGLELEYRLRGAWGYATVGYSLYEADDNRVASYAVSTDDDALLGMARHKLTVGSSFRLGERFRVAPSLVYLGDRWAYTHLGEDGDPALSELGSQTLLNLYLTHTGLFGTPLELGIGVFDLLGENVLYAQPYDNYHAPYPGTSRELVVRLGYRR